MSKGSRRLSRGDRRRNDRLAALRAVAVSYTHLRAHETVLDLVCRLLLEKKKYNTNLSDKQILQSTIILLNKT